MTNDHLQQLDNKLRELCKELEDDLLKYKDKGWLDNSIMNISVEKSIAISERGRDNILENYYASEMCSCGSRQKSKCVKENGYNSGKMCLREDEE